MWIFMAVLSAVFAGFKSVFAKCGIKNTDSDIATAIRTGIVLLFSLLAVILAGSFDTIKNISTKSLVFLILSGITTGAAWLCFFKALSLGNLNKVIPVDKFSTVITVLAAIILLGETNNLVPKLICTACLTVGICLMIEKKPEDGKNANSRWLFYAVLSAVFTSASSILASFGIHDVESNLGTAIRTIVTLIMAWAIIFAKGKQTQLREIDRKELGFIILSGIATGASWACYHHAIKTGIVSVVEPIDKLSILITISFSVLVLKEKLTKKAVFGLVLIVAATVFMAIKA